MKKRGDLSIQVIVIAALSLVVLFILLSVFNTQIRNSVKSYFKLGEQAEEQAKGDRCTSALGNNFCAQGTSCPSESTEVFGDFNDCKDGRVCCERIS